MIRFRKISSTISCPIEREGAVDIDLIEDSERRIVEFLNRQGY